MLPTPAAILLIKHLEDIDKIFSKGLEGSKPKGEEALTSDLCRLLDNRESEQFKLRYKRPDLVEDIQKLYGNQCKLNFRLETNEYSKFYEAHITQSDLGIVLNYNNYDIGESWTESFLFQAKAVKPSEFSPLEYNLNSKFSATNQPQIDRINKLNQVLPVDFIRYMHYTPRLNSSKINVYNKGQLKLLRDTSISSKIFMTSLDKILHDNFMNGGNDLCSGIFISPLKSLPKSLRDIYISYYLQHIPLSWFITERLTTSKVQNFFENTNRKYKTSLSIKFNPKDISSVSHGIVRGDRESIRYVENKLNLKNYNYTIYPHRTLYVDFNSGG